MLTAKNQKRFHAREKKTTQTTAKDIVNTSQFDWRMADHSDLDRQIDQLKRCEIIKEHEVKALCAKAREILVEEGNVQRVDSPVTVSGPVEGK